MENRINFSKIERKWQKKWEEKKVFEAKEGRKKKYYVLEMFPYPSGSGLHMGHAFNYTIGDILARFMRMKGCNVLYPMGYDSFGLPAENAAIKEKKHPKKFTDNSIKNFVKQQKSLGLSYDWSRILRTSDPEYYKWNQYFFLKFLENDLVYRKKSAANWCPKCRSVLANEQVHNGKCWRHTNTEVAVKQLEQWFVRTTKYADELLKDLDKLDWPERIKVMQRNWIGKSKGVEIEFRINDKPWRVFTTRPDTLFGVTFLVVSAQHPDLMDIVAEEKKEEVEEFLEKVRKTKQEDLGKLDKEGVFTGSYAKHPLTGDMIPVYAGNFVLAEYGSGIVMAVPAHDQRDFEFAKKYNLPVKTVVHPKEKNLAEEKMKEAYEEEGILTNSGKFDGIHSPKAGEKIVKNLESEDLGKSAVNYKLRDWLVSRQRYWGTPIPVIYCERCGIAPVPEKDLPVELPEKVEFGKGNPLKTSRSFVEVKCPKCGKKGKRETDTMDTFFDSSWYYLRFLDNKNSKKAFEEKKTKYWMPVDFYIGGAEHACMHLIYARFFTKALRDLGFLSFDEPFKKLFNQGMFHGPDGSVMSKSKGNVVLPEEVSEKYGIDTARLFLVSVGGTDKDREWDSKGVEGSLRFIKKVFEFVSKAKIGKSSRKIESKINKFIKEIGEEISSVRYNFAVIKLRKLFDNLENEISKKDLESFLKLLSPFCPHIAEELWEKIGNKSFICLEEWPEADLKKIDEKFEKAEKDTAQVIEDVKNIVKLLKEKDKKAEKIFLYVIPKEIENYDTEIIGKSVGTKVKVYPVNDKEKYDPEGKSKKAKPGKPGIYVE